MPLTLSVAVPTYQREEILIDTISNLLKQSVAANEILIMDQTPLHGADVGARLEEWNKEGAIRWIRLKEASQPKALNRALLDARSDLVLCLDDDIIPSDDLVKYHLEAHQSGNALWAVVGRITQPWQDPNSREHSVKIKKDNIDFNYNSANRCFVNNAMSGNLSVRRDKAIQIGGFDENFVKVAYRFDSEFAKRLIGAGGKILFEPMAQLRHLRVKSGGTRSFGDYLSSIFPDHSVGAYYYFFRTKNIGPAIFGSMQRFAKSVCTKYHLRRPWRIPATLVAEFWGFAWALVLSIQGPRCLRMTKQ